MPPRSDHLSEELARMIDAIPVGGTGRIRFPWSAVPIHISITTSGGWNFKYTLIPGMEMEFVRGSDHDVSCIDITIGEAKSLE